MATVSSLTAARMLEIERSSVVSGAVDSDGKLKLTRRDGTEFDAGTVKGADGSNTQIVIPATAGSSYRYVRIAYIDGRHASAGDAMQFLMSGLGDWGLASRKTMLVHFGQRGTDGYQFRAWSWGVERETTKSLFYVRQLSEFQFELWARTGMYMREIVVTMLAPIQNTNYVQLTADNYTTTEPDGLVLQTVAEATHSFATNAETAAGLVDDKMVSPSNLRASINMPPGVIMPYGGASAPTGSLLCNGAAVSRTTYSALYAVLGNSYGSGDGSTTFNLPDLRGRIPVGIDSSQTEFNLRGETGGAKTHKLTVDEMPSHTHVQNSHNHTQNSHNHTQNAHSHSQGFRGGWGVSTGQSGNGAANDGYLYPNPSTGSATATNNATTATNNATTAVNQNSGGGDAHNNLQPYVAMHYIIST